MQILNKSKSTFYVFLIWPFFALSLTSCSAQNSVCLPVEMNPYPNDPALVEFTQYVHVLDCFEVFAEAGISEEKVLHVAAVIAELLDQNEDGIVDDFALAEALDGADAMMPVFTGEGSVAEDVFFEMYEGDGVSAVLYAGEINPSEPGYWGEDATVEEVLHTINHVGHVVLHPDAFGLAPGSSLLTEAMDVARGGQFLSVPDEYPEEAWYHYDDWTCDYECMAIEYLYWAIVTEMGILDDPQTAQGIANEWEPYSPALLESMDPLVHNLINNSTFALPLQAPDGNYCPSATDIHAPSNDGVSLVKIVDLMGRISRAEAGALQLYIYEDGRVVKKVIAND